MPGRRPPRIMRLDEGGVVLQRRDLGSQLAVAGARRCPQRCAGRRVAGCPGGGAPNRVGLRPVPHRDARERRAGQRPLPVAGSGPASRGVAGHPLERSLVGPGREPRRARKGERRLPDERLCRQRQRRDLHPGRDDRAGRSPAGPGLQAPDRTHRRRGAPLRRRCRRSGDLPVPEHQHRGPHQGDHVSGGSDHRAPAGLGRSVRPDGQRCAATGGHGGGGTAARCGGVLVGRRPPARRECGRPRVPGRRDALRRPGRPGLHLRHSQTRHGPPTGAGGHPPAGSRTGGARRVGRTRPPGAGGSGARRARRARRRDRPAPCAPWG